MPTRQSSEVRPRRKSSRKNSSVTMPATVSVGDEEIRLRAYQIFLNRGGEHGHDLEDWLHAEREIAARAARHGS
jgi:hypothetical protein